MENTKKHKKKAADFILLISVIILIFIGMIMVFSASWPIGMAKYNSGYFFLKKQVLWAGLGCIGLFLAMNYDYKKIKKWAPYIFFFSILLGILVFTPMGAEVKGARRWLDIGTKTKFIRIMPSDAIKFGMILFFSMFLANKRDKIGTFWHGTFPSLFYIALACGVIIKEDLGTGGTVAITMLIMFFVAGMNILHVLPLGAGAAGIFYWAIMDPQNAHRMNRITSFRDPFVDKLGTGWQAVQSLYALGAGGIFGLGLGKSRQKFFYLSEAYNDFIFAIIGEELGLIGTVVVVLLFLLVIWRGTVIALRIDEPYGCFLATGITALIAVQSLIHIAVVTSSMPTTGITLPFVSYGGTSLVMYMTLVGILLNISRHVKVERS